MKSLNIKQVKAYNFLAFGENGVEINFEKLGKIVLIKGKNLDFLKEKNDLVKNKDSSNGSGKSSVQEIICYAIYGKTVKNPKKISKDDVINNIVKKNCKVEIIFDDYKIIRGRSPDSLRLWKSEKQDWTKDNEITQGKMQDTQEKIESIIGINYDVFVSTCIFTDDQANCFLESDLSSKRSIIENLLSLDIYRDRHEYSKNLLKDNKNNIKQLSSEYKLLSDNGDVLNNRLKSTKETETSWKKTKAEEINRIISDVKNKKDKLKFISQDKELKDYKDAQIKIKNINKSIDKVTNEIEKLENSLNENNQKHKQLELDLNSKKEKISSINYVIVNKKETIKKNTEELNKLNKKNNEKKCGYCLSEINPENFKEIIKNYEDENIKLNKEVDALSEDIEKIEVNKIQVKYDDINKIIKKINKDIFDKKTFYKNLRDEYKELSLIKEPNLNNEKSSLEKELAILIDKLKDLRDQYCQPSPYDKVIKEIEEDINNLNKNISDKKDSIKDIENNLPYLDFWVEAFGDSGIRKWVVDGIIPILNKKLQYLMSILDNNRLKIEFDNKLQEKIYKIIDGKEVEFKYHTLSAGQKRRLNLAVSQSFAHIMINSVGSCPGLVFLDEVTTNIDPIGVLGIYNLICELAEERQVFVTTHDADLLDMLSGCNTLNFEMENGVSRLEIKK